MADATETLTAEQGEALANEMAAMADAAKSPTKMDAVKGFLWRYIGGAFADNKNGEKVASLGRVAFVVWFGQATYKWQTMTASEDLPDSMMTIGLSLLAFVTGTKLIGAIAKRVKA